MIVQSILWKRLDRPGCESSQLLSEAAGWRLRGTSLFTEASQPCRLEYEIECDSSWRTRSAQVAGWLGREAVKVELKVTGEGSWRLDGRPCPQVSGCIDLDLHFSPATNLLPVRRLALAVGEQARVQAAWLRFPSFRLEPLDQVYRRLAEDVYQYESAGGRFKAELQVNETGYVTTYPGLWRAEARA